MRFPSISTLPASVPSRRPIVYAFAFLGCISCSPLVTLGKQGRKQVGFKSVSKVRAHEEAMEK
ncbi:hypothetical protein Q2T83_15795 [Fervidibacter sacchari]|uniref:Uncharacterized protein n=1 Tax=Candidatus Fervidibacter sacchari TaxID=1448929 RepID=A0ABT2EJ58_9BACT|nr:hypothetical protein [Candidatus Fervidibacter sacchari]MCS3917967.1 hypothetical protein [Candidatus Fervidibacter sacchari]WKU15783.1 hypothetical protein Q2T83_15795 [Candidatus Fervidibacter sacchari]